MIMVFLLSQQYYSCSTTQVVATAAALLQPQSSFWCAWSWCACTWASGRKFLAFFFLLFGCVLFYHLDLCAPKIIYIAKLVKFYLQCRGRYRGYRYSSTFLVHCTCLMLCCSKFSHVKCAKNISTSRATDSCFGEAFFKICAQICTPKQHGVYQQKPEPRILRRINRALQSSGFACVFDVKKEVTPFWFRASAENAMCVLLNGSAFGVFRTDTLFN